VPVSAKLRFQLDGLEKELKRFLPENEPIFGPDDITDRSEKFLASEIVREKLFRFVGDELPYTSTVLIEKFEQEGDLRRVFAAILVERDTHKSMIIGNKGARLKEVSTQARWTWKSCSAARCTWKSGSRSNPAGPTTKQVCAPTATSKRAPHTQPRQPRQRGAGAPAAAAPRPLPRPAAAPPAARAAVARERTVGTKVAGQPAFVLHSYPYKETSLIIDCSRATSAAWR
jgi:hypothetical protein